jgi:hypothetical protein
MSDTPISDSTPHNVAELGMLCRRIERELTAANAIIRQQQLLDEENLRLQERIKRLEEAGDAIDPMNDSECECDSGYVVVCKHCFDRSENWRKAKEAKP